MITRLSLSNFRSLGPDVVLDLGRLNFLVGVNGSGKSNVLHALSFVREAVRAGLPRSVTSSGGIVALRRHSAGRPHDIRIELDLALPDGTGSYGFELAGDRIEEYKVKEEWARVDGAQGRVAFRQSRGRWEGPENLRPNLGPQSLAITALGGDPRVRPLWEHLAGMMVYSIYPDMLREPQKFIPEMPMRRRGENWVSVLHEQRRRGWKSSLVDALHKLTGDLEDIRTRRTSTFLMAEFRHPAGREGTSKRSRRWFGADLESDGTLRVAGLLTALLQEPHLPVIGVEEPEVTVHPGAIPLLYDFMQEASTRSQVFVTTHSPLLLDRLEGQWENVFVVDRSGGISSVRPLAEDQREALRDKLLTLGDLMRSGDLEASLSEPEG